MDLLLVDPEHLRERPGVPLHALAGVMDDQLVAVPRERDRVGFDRVVVVARGRVRAGRPSAGRRSARPPHRRPGPRPAGRRGCRASAHAPWPPRRCAAARTRMSTSISEAAWSACSCVSARTIAIGSPFQWMLSSCITGRLLRRRPPWARSGTAAGVASAARCGGSSRARRRRAASAAPVSSVVMRPRAIVL